ncbi:glycosyltransferase [Ruegeria sp. 2012CJ41-6]|uniref:Glycosyltransferase n=1 Tax=Ruegeria spongiae TaxID=2942209 RepID=A0ABT0PZV2_9RHOB|nr:glycosyltransferase family 2 protein [Ruegeria spongiae]MCL6283156.1 glycosyltransferase [Ruegeria spongiae]
MSKPLISVITVTRNLIEAGRSETMRAALDCVQAQSFRGLEHVIWDGASTDGTQSLLQAWQAEFSADATAIPIICQSDADSGLYDAMNKAVGLASGDYVIFLNSDDSLASDDILRELAAIVQSDRPDFVYGGTLQTLGDGSTRNHSRTNLSAFLQRMPFCHNSMLVRRDVFLALGGHDLSYRVASDYDFVFRMLMEGHSGAGTKLPVSKFSARGVSANVLGVARDYAEVWSRYFGQMAGCGKIDSDTTLNWYRTGQLPVSMCRAALRAAKGNDIMRRAALHSLKITMRRRMQPWRKWDYLKGA